MSLTFSLRRFICITRHSRPASQCASGQDSFVRVLIPVPSIIRPSPRASQLQPALRSQPAFHPEPQQLTTGNHSQPPLQSALKHSHTLSHSHNERLPALIPDCFLEQSAQRAQRTQCAQYEVSVRSHPLQPISDASKPSSLGLRLHLVLLFVTISSVTRSLICWLALLSED